jgi:transcriptional regulator with XRE-family HTH domain
VKINTNIKRERLTKGWTQGYVGKQVGVTKTAVHDIENLRRKPSYDVLIKLENLFNQDHRYLFAQAAEDEQQLRNRNHSNLKL